MHNPPTKWPIYDAPNQLTDMTLFILEGSKVITAAAELIIRQTLTRVMVSPLFRHITLPTTGQLSKE